MHEYILILKKVKTIQYRTPETRNAVNSSKSGQYLPEYVHEPYLILFNYLQVTSKSVSASFFLKMGDD